MPLALHFARPGMLALALAAAIPLWLHLKRKQMSGRRFWGATHLLENAAGEHKRKHEWKEQWLLAARMGSVLAAVSAAAGPYWGAPPGSSLSAPLILLLDESLSMLRVSQGNSAWERGQQVSMKLLQTPGLTEAAWVSSSGDQLLKWSEPTLAAASIREAVPRATVSRWPLVMDQVESLLREKHGRQKPRIVLIHDRVPEPQSTPLDFARLQSLGDLELVDVGASSPPQNVFVSSLAMLTQAPVLSDEVIFQAQWQHTGQLPKGSIRWVVDGAPVASVPVSASTLSAEKQGTHQSTWKHHFATSGEHVISAQWLTDAAATSTNADVDEVIEDNTQSIQVTVRKQLRVLCVEDSANTTANGPESAISSSRFLAAALAPVATLSAAQVGPNVPVGTSPTPLPSTTVIADPSANRRDGEPVWENSVRPQPSNATLRQPIHVDLAATDGWADRDLLNYDVICFVDVSRPTRRDGALLETWLQNGKGLWWIVADQADAGAYQSALVANRKDPLFPAEIGPAGDVRGSLKLTLEISEPVSLASRTPSMSDLSTVISYVEGAVTSVRCLKPLKSRSKVLGAWENCPALVQGTAKGGQVLVWPTSVGANPLTDSGEPWCRLPFSPTFVPWSQSIVRRLADLQSVAPHQIANVNTADSLLVRSLEGPKDIAWIEWSRVTDLNDDGFDARSGQIKSFELYPATLFILAACLIVERMVIREAGEVNL